MQRGETRSLVTLVVTLPSYVTRGIRRYARLVPIRPGPLALPVLPQ